MKNGNSRALCANFEQDIEHFNAEGRTASIVTSYSQKRNAVEQDVHEDSVERSLSRLIDKVWLNILTGMSGATHEVHLKIRLTVWLTRTFHSMSFSLQSLKPPLFFFLLP